MSMELDVQAIDSRSLRSSEEDVVDADAQVSIVSSCSADHCWVQHTATGADAVNGIIDSFSPEDSPGIAGIANPKVAAFDFASMPEFVQCDAACAERSLAASSNVSVTACNLAALNDVPDTRAKCPNRAAETDVEPSSWDLGPDSIGDSMRTVLNEDWGRAQRPCDEAEWALAGLLAKQKAVDAGPCTATALQQTRMESEESQRFEKICEAYEWETFSLGPFREGCTCEILEAKYGVPDIPERHVDVTQHVLTKWEEQSVGGLKLKGFNALFGDPAPWDVRKKLTVRYCLSHTRGDVRAWDVSHGRYAEGIAARGSLGLVTGMKVMSNVVGVAAAAAGYTAGMLSTGVTRHISDNDLHVVDSIFSRIGYQSWLLSNGIFPTLTFDPLEKSAAALEAFYAEVGIECAGRPLHAEDLKMTSLIVSNHISYLDGMVLAHALGCPRIIAAAGTTRTPLVGKFAEELVIEVDRNDADSRAKTLEAIRSHVAGWAPGGRPLLVFPEGTTSNGDELLEFRRGAFVSSVPVRPVVLFYTGAWHPANTNFRETSEGEVQPTGDSEWYGQFFGHLAHTLQVRVMRPYVPDTEERADPRLFARNVRHAMGEVYAELREEHAKSTAEQQWTSTPHASQLWGQCGGDRKAKAPSPSRSVLATHSPFDPCSEDPSG